MTTLVDPVKVLNDAIVEGTTFGTQNTTKPVSFIVKVLSMMVPGILLGHYIDKWVEYAKEKQMFGEAVGNYVALQTAVNIGVFYVMYLMNEPFTQEFQNTYAGLFFVSLYFGMQSKYIANLQTVLV